MSGSLLNILGISNERIITTILTTYLQIPESIARKLATGNCTVSNTSEFYDNLSDEVKRTLSNETMRGRQGVCEARGCQSKVPGKGKMCRSICIKCTMKNTGMINKGMCFICSEKCLTAHIQEQLPSNQNPSEVG